jgi:hypothetical protein
MTTSRERVISIVLSDEDWQAFVRIQPEPVEWLRERIKEMVSGGISESGAISESFVASLVDEASTTSATTR